MDVLHAGDELLGVLARGEETAAGVVPEQLDEGIGGSPGLVGPFRLPRGLAEAREGLYEPGVIG